MRPNPLIARAYLARGARLWFGVRVLGSAAIAFGGMSPLHLTFGATMLIVTASVALGLVDMRRRHERALLENLGVTRITCVAFTVVPALLGEVSISLLAGLQS
ncbi:MAG: hypothetical protein ABJF01_05960 [bacterium]